MRHTRKLASFAIAAAMAVLAALTATTASAAARGQPKAPAPAVKPTAAHRLAGHGLTEPAAVHASVTRRPTVPRVRVVNLRPAYLNALPHARAGKLAGLVYPRGMQPRIHPRHVRVRHGGRVETCTEPNCPLVWNNGSVQHTPRVYLLLWGPNWSTDTATVTYMENFYSGLGVSPQDDWSTVTSQYGDTTGYPTFSGAELAGTVQDVSVPPSGVTPNQLAAEADAYAATFGITDKTDSQIVVATQSGTWPECFNGRNCQPGDHSYCAWHSSSSGGMPFTNLPYQTDAGINCGEDLVQNQRDGFSIVGGHEYAETVTDPFPNTGWVDTADQYGGEIGDKCAWYDPVTGFSDIVTMALSTGTFAVQPLFSNSGYYSTGDGCADTVWLSPPSNQSTIVGSAVSVKLEAASTLGRALTWRATGLPPGLSINSATGLISGTMGNNGVYHPAVTVTDSAGASASATFNWTGVYVLRWWVGVGSEPESWWFGQDSAWWLLHHPHCLECLGSVDAVNWLTGQIGDPIQTKLGCPTISRPAGSSAGITALITSPIVDGYPCVDYARSDRGRLPSDPPFAPGGIAFVPLATGGVTYATPTVTNAPPSLTSSQLLGIYSCAIRNWAQVGGRNAPIKPFLPENGTGSGAVFLTAIGLSTPGSCVSTDVPGDDGVAPQLASPDVIVPYSISSYIAQRYHSARCLNSACTPVGGAICNPTATQNQFGCDTLGTLKLGEINHLSPTVGSGTSTAINPAFTESFLHSEYAVVRYDSATADHIPAPLEQFFGTRGWFCTSSAAKAYQRDYGFLPSPSCGHAS